MTDVLITNEPIEELSHEHPFLTRRHLFGALAMVLLGMIEGVGFAASGTFSPIAVRYQMVFQIWVILKLFLGAMGMSMVTQGIYFLLAPEGFRKTRFYENFSVGYLRAIGGSFILGIGMTCAGSGPTMLPAQMGAGVAMSGWIFLGVMSGSMAFAIIEPLLFETNLCRKKGEKTVAEDLVGGNYAVIAIPTGLVILGVGVLLEFIVPHNDDKWRIGTNGATPLFPVIAGVANGILQVPVRMITGDGLGGSSYPMNIIATLTCGKLSARHRITSMVQLYQLLYVLVGISLGSLLFAQNMPGFTAPWGYPVQQTLVGGFLMAFGSRIANGCTCGHGISGTSELSLQSFFAAGSIFAGAIATAFFLYGIDVVQF